MKDGRTERRREHRLNVRSMSSYSIARPDGSYATLGIGHTLDLSLAGVGLKIQEPLPLGELIEVRLRLDETLHSGHGQVVRLDERPGGIFEVGVSLGSVSFDYVCEVFTRSPFASALGVAVRGDDLFELVCSLAESRKSGLLMADVGGRKSFLGLRHGRIVAARHRRERGRKAICEVLGIQSGIAAFFPHELEPLVAEHVVPVTDALVRRLRVWRKTGQTTTSLAA